ncbi:twitching motility protein PilT [Achromatium sp. WMS3]|nr:twitching motility protein PilT [Achromatium sp. WMS3]
MELLLDTHALLWWLDGDERLSFKARSLIADETNRVWVSAASAWEIATKVRIGKLPGAKEVAERFIEVMTEQKFALLSISAQHAQTAGLFTWKHRDPFDRILIAQSQIEKIPLVSNETLFDKFGIQRIW